MELLHLVILILILRLPDALVDSRTYAQWAADGASDDRGPLDDVIE